MGESTREYGLHGNHKWTRRPGGRCWSCLQKRKERLGHQVEEQLEAARTANAALRPCWTCRGSMGRKAGSPLERDEEVGPVRDASASSGLITRMSVLGDAVGSGATGDEGHRA